MKLFYNDLNNEQTHDLFGQFVKLWNAGRLAQKYYVGAVAGTTYYPLAHCTSVCTHACEHMR